MFVVSCVCVSDTRNSERDFDYWCTGTRCQAVLLQRAHARTRVCESVAAQLRRPRSVVDEPAESGRGWPELVLRRRLRQPNFLANADGNAGPHARQAPRRMPEEAVFGPLRLLKISDLENKASRECTRSLGCTAAEASLLQRKRKAATPSGGSRELELETARRPGRLLRVGAGRGTDSGAMRMLMLEDFAELDSVKGLQGSIRRTLVLIRVRHQRRAVARQQAAIVIQQLARCVDARTAASCRRELLACARAAQCIQRAFQCKKSRALVSALRQAQIEKKEKEKIRSEDSVEGVEGGGRGGAAARGDGGACGISEDRVEYDATESMAADIGNARQGIGKSWKSQGSYAVGKRSIVLLQQAGYHSRDVSRCSWCTNASSCHAAYRK